MNFIRERERKKKCILSFVGQRRRTKIHMGLVSFNKNREKSEYESSSEEVMRSGGTYVSHDDLKAFPRERE